MIDCTFERTNINTMDKRNFLKAAGILGAGALLSPTIACVPRAVTQEVPIPGQIPPGNGVLPEFSLPPLGYAFTALEPVIDAMTMEIHHDKHHAGYVTNLNKALVGNSKYEGATLETILASVAPEEAAVRNNAGGHYNHSKFWKWIAPGGSNQPNPVLLAAIVGAFGSFEAFQQQFSEAAKTRFGSGWAWLCVGQDKKLFVGSTPNQDNHLMKNISDKPGTPILGIDVWEHAYYLKYQNKRADYITAFFGIVNWDQVAADFLTLGVK